MANQKYNNRKFEMVCVPEETYHNHFKRLEV